MPPPRTYRQMMESLREPPPKSIKEVPGYVKRVSAKFFKRLFYILMLVWESQPIVLFIMLFMAVFNGVTPVIGSFINANLLNTLALAYTGDAPYEAIVSVLLLRFGFNLFCRIVGSVTGIVQRICGELVTNHIKVKIMNKSKELDLACFDMPEFYSKMENANREAGGRPMQILGSTLRIISTVISMVSYIVILAAISKWIPVIIIIMSIPSAIVSFVYRSRNVNYIKQRSKDRRQMGYYSGIVTNKDLVKEVRIFGLFDMFIGRYREIFGRYFDGQKKLIIGEGAWHLGLSVVSTIISCFLFLYIGKQVALGVLMVGSFSLYTGALGSISGGVNGLIGTTAEIYEGTLFIDNLIDFMSQKQTVVALLPESFPVTHGIGHTIVFDNVSFRYPGTERDVMKHVSATFAPGDTIALVGLNGAGKTTLIKLLTRLYDPTEGTIYLDGRDIREYEPNDLYKVFGMIFQDFGKYAVTVDENIRFGRLERDATEEEVTEAATRSAAGEFIEALPLKYSTPLMRYFDDDGIELSIGQWQKLAVARAFYSESDVIILDEPTASLDALAEQEIFNQFDALRQHKTTIFVSHRLSSATLANKILVLENGEIIESGNHEELMKLHGRYWQLFTTQASRYINSGDSDGNPHDGDGGDIHGDIHGDDIHDGNHHGDLVSASGAGVHGGRRHDPRSGTEPHSH